MSHTCTAIACEERIFAGLFCAHHWNMVPQETAETIATIRQAKRHRWAYLSDTAFLEACVSAVDGIAQAEGVSGESSFHRLLTEAARSAGE